jgi:hypothetical protein
MSPIINSRVCTPVGTLLSEKYQQDWISDKQSAASRLHTHQKSKNIEKLGKLTKSSKTPPTKPVPKPVFFLSKFMEKTSKTDCWRYAVEDHRGGKFKSVPPTPFDVQAIEKAKERWCKKNGGVKEEKVVGVAQGEEVVPVELEKHVSFTQGLAV